MKYLFKQKLFRLIVVFLILASCRKNATIQSIVVNGEKPTALFSYSPNTANALDIQFNNLSTNATSYYWKFGDGTTSTDSMPVHTYAASGRYTVTLTTRSNAGYSADTSIVIIAAAKASAAFSETASNVMVSFNNLSTSIDSCSWDFGDNSATTNVISPTHVFPSVGKYPVKLTVYGIAGDTVTVIDTVAVTPECINGGSFKSSDAQYWTIWNLQTGIPPTFGYTADVPTGSTGGTCLAFPSFADASNGSGLNELIYQPVYVEAGKQYQFSALVKLAGGGIQCYFQFYLSNDPNTWSENNGNQPTQLFMSLNTWHGWGGYNGWNQSIAVDGSMLQLVQSYGSYGHYATNGIYTATTTGWMYLGIQAGTWEGYSNGAYLVSDVSFAEIP